MGSLRPTRPAATPRSNLWRARRRDYTGDGSKVFKVMPRSPAVQWGVADLIGKEFVSAAEPGAGAHHRARGRLQASSRYALNRGRPINVAGLAACASTASP